MSSEPSKSDASQHDTINSMPRKAFGLAVGGLGGFNAHDAGVLKAAKDCGFEPDAITCTSGAIYWVALFIDPDDRTGEKLQAGIADAVAERRWWNLLQLMVSGNRVLRPAHIEYLMSLPREMIELSVKTFDALSSFSRSLLKRPDVDTLGDAWWQALATSGHEVLDMMLPAHVAVSKLQEKDFAYMLMHIDQHPRPILLNAIDIGTGQELVFFNKATVDPVHGLESVMRHIGRDAGPPSRHGLVRRYMPLTSTDQLRQALWLSFYGFRQDFGNGRSTVIDGAYRRQIILSELYPCEKVFVVKPQPLAYRDEPPENYWDVQDFNTEMWFNSSYAAEVAGIELVNDLLKKGHLQSPTPKDPKKYHPCTVIPIEINKPLGVSNYLRERMSVFEESHRAAKRLFKSEMKCLKSTTT